MKAKNYKLKMFALSVMAGVQPMFAQLNVPSDGSDGLLNITNNTVIDLSQAVTGTWSDNNTANAGKGVYDPEKWAVVFKYSSISIATNVTVSFVNHLSHAPVVWLIQSNATINGRVNLDGSMGTSSYPGYLIPTEPGPGGFRGSAYSSVGNGSGYGPGGVQGWTTAASYTGTYGNPQIMPLIGGSGSADGIPNASSSGNSGGGAILVAAGGTLSIYGQVSANRAGWYINSGVNEYSSGGAVRVIANQVIGSGTIIADRTRVEANGISPLLNIFPNTVAVPPGTTPVIWPPATTPIVKVISVNGQSTPSDPLAGVLTSSDVNVQTNNAVDILLMTSNFPPSGLVSVRVNPKYSRYFFANATFVSGTFSNALWKATTTMPNGFCVLQAHATSP